MRTRKEPEKFSRKLIFCCHHQRRWILNVHTSEDVFVVFSKVTQTFFFLPSFFFFFFLLLRNCPNLFWSIYISSPRFEIWFTMSKMVKKILGGFWMFFFLVFWILTKFLNNLKSSQSFLTFNSFKSKTRIIQKSLIFEVLVLFKTEVPVCKIWI